MTFETLTSHNDIICDVSENLDEDLSTRKG